MNYLVKIALLILLPWADRIGALFWSTIVSPRSQVVTMTPEDVTKHREQLAYIKDMKDMILSDGRALYSLRGYLSHKATFDVVTSTLNGRWQASLIMYPDLSNDTRFTSLYEGVQCKDLPTAFKMLWDGLQTGLGDSKARHQAAVMCQSPRSVRAEHPTVNFALRERSSSNETLVSPYDDQAMQAPAA